MDLYGALRGRRRRWRLGEAPTPDGTQAALLQSYLGSTASVSQTITFPADGQYTVSFIGEQRPLGGNNQTVEVLVDGNDEGEFTPSSGNSWDSFTTAPFAITAGDHTLEFTDLNLSGDQTAFIDSVAVNSVGAGGSVVLNGNGLTVTGERQYDDQRPDYQQRPACLVRTAGGRGG